MRFPPGFKPGQFPRLYAIFSDARVAVRQMNGTEEIAELDERIDPRRVAGIIKSVPRYCSELSPSDFARLSMATGHAVMVATTRRPWFPSAGR